MSKKLLLSLLIIPFVSFAAYADNDDDEECDEHEHHEKEYDHDKKHFNKVFKEGSLNIVSPFAYDRDTFSIQYSHNYYLSSFPRGSNPYFSLSYSPINNLQADFAVTLRDEFEGGIKYQIFNEFAKDLFSLTPKISFNSRGRVAGLDITASKVFFNDIWQLGLNYRLMNYFGDPKIDGLTSTFAQAIGVNTIVRVWNNWSLFGDAVIPFDSNLISQKSFVWSAGIKKRIDYSPHIVTLYVGNTNESTLTGKTFSSVAKYPEALKVGFNFSIDIENFTQLPKRLF